MQTLSVDILNPKAVRLLEDLAELNASANESVEQFCKVCTNAELPQ